VVVLGHTGCGVISTALQEIERPLEDHSPNLHAIIDRVRPIVEESVRTGQGLPPADLARDAVRRNVEASAEYLRHDSEVLADLIERDGLMVVCAEYSLDTGEVAFFGDEEAR
jgi:carbonic anhydrase